MDTIRTTPIIHETDYVVIGGGLKERWIIISIPVYFLSHILWREGIKKYTGANRPKENKKLTVTLFKDSQFFHS